jgi:hypothetical protein
MVRQYGNLLAVVIAVTALVLAHNITDASTVKATPSNKGQISSRISVLPTAQNGNTGNRFHPVAQFEIDKSQFKRVCYPT